MWMTICRQCGWTSGERILQDAAESMGKLHAEDHAGHTVGVMEVAGRTGTPRKPNGRAT
jgi:hypothetical protein